MLESTSVTKGPVEPNAKGVVDQSRSLMYTIRVVTLFR